MARYLLDTNSVIYFFNGVEKIAALVEDPDNEILVSFISKIELLSFESEDKAVVRSIEQFLDETTIVFPDDAIITQTINYRRSLKIKIPDALICATARALKIPLVTADKEIRRKVKTIKTISPV